MLAVALVHSGRCATVASTEPNMNGPYLLSSTPDAPPGVEHLFPASYSQYPGGGEFFDVYSPPITSTYGEVFWTPLPPVKLPGSIVERFANGKAMAVIGFECNQVRVNEKGEEVSVPINVAYNHHFETLITGAHSTVERVPHDDPRAIAASGGHRLPVREEDGTVEIVKELQPSTNGLPTHQAFGGANGGEFRKSFHGYPPGYAQVIVSPDTWHHTPMQIDTWHREKMDVAGGTPFVAGPLPRSSLSPGSPHVKTKSAGDVLYSGLLECPVTTRIRKHVQEGYQPVLQGLGGCAAGARGEHHGERRGGAAGTHADADGGGTRPPPPESLANCSHAVKSLAPPLCRSYQPSQGSSTAHPAGCSFSLDASRGAADGVCNVFWNELTAPAATAECGGERSTAAGQAAFGSLAWRDGQIHVNVSLDAQHATIEIAGPADAWFGLGLNSTTMGGGGEGARDGPYAIIVSGGGGATNVTERRLANHAPGELLTPSLTVLAAHAADGIRTVRLRRPLAGATRQHYSFDRAADASLNVIMAVGGGPTFGRDHHRLKTTERLLLLPPAGAPACVCPAPPRSFGSAVGSLEYIDPLTNQSNGSVGFSNVCAPPPRMDTLAQHNPTCDLRTYSGGQTACHHGWTLLDADQSIPWSNVTLTYVHKFRFWFQEYDAAVHTNVLRTTWGIASPVEYDVPQCAPGTPTKDCVHSISGLGMFAGPRAPSGPDMRLVAAHFHCHAPTCLSIALYSCNPSVHTECANRTLLCEERPVYGQQMPTSAGPFAEPGYIAQPPCLWGDAKYGLAPPLLVSGVNLYAVAKTNSTYGHHGEMAWLQVYYEWAPRDR